MVAYKWIVLTNTTLGLLMASINSTIILIALPAIFRGLGVYPFAPSAFVVLLWALLGFGVITATLVVSVGRLSDMYGRTRMYNAGFAVFTVGSLMLFLLPSGGILGGWELVGFRLVQGVGAAFIFANAAALIADAFPPTERGRALGINQVASIGGAVLGLVLGGVLSAAPTVHLGGLVIEGWRFVFLVSVPVGVFGTFWAYRKLHETARIRKGGRIDLPGNITFGLGLTLLLAGLTYGLIPYGSSSNGWSSPWVWGAIGSALALLVAFFGIELRTADPMFRLSLFRNRAFAAGNLSALLGWMALGGLQFMLILWFQGIWLPLHGYSFSVTPFWAGIYMLPLMGGFIALGPLSGALSDRWGARSLSTFGLAIAAFSFLGLLTLP
ncbi:MAG: MFS transporter, partial [Thermoplasmata archaeon]